MDLYSQQIGAEFSDISGFQAMIGGSPANIAIGTSRLGLSSAILTAVGSDPIGDFVKTNFGREGVDTSFIQTFGFARTGLAILGVQPPDRFPLTFYRDNPADIHLRIEHAQELPWDNISVLQLSGTALARGTARETTFFAGERSGEGTTVLLDLDLRPDQWSDLAAYGVSIRSLLPNCQVVVGTEEEFHAALSPSSSTAMTGQLLRTDELAQLDDLLGHILFRQPGLVLLLKRGAEGVTVYTSDDRTHVAGYPVEVVNTVGAGDAFASGVIYGRIKAWDWAQTVRFANACGAIEVTRHGCSLALPTVAEVEEFMATYD